MGNGIDGSWSGTTRVTPGDTDHAALIAGERWTAGTLYYSFPSGTAWYTDNYSEWDSWAALPVAGRYAVQSVLDDIARLVDLSFQPIADLQTQAGDLRFTLTTEDSGFSGWAYYPGTHPKSGDVWLCASPSAYAPQPGDWDYQTIIHEIGHALGLAHPFANDPGWSTSAYAPLHFSTMNYSSQGGGSYSTYPTTPSVLDVRALWELYGQNTVASAGNDTYTFTEDGRYLEVLWDAGGIDTIDYGSATSGGLIDLTPGSWSRMGAEVTREGTRIHNIHLIDDGNAATADLIENAIGGSGNDSITGNGAANRLRGGAGSDTLAGGLGNDRLDGGRGADRMEGGGGNDVYLVDNRGDRITEGLRGGLDTVTASVSLPLLPRNVEQVVLTGGRPLDATGNGLANTLTGNAARNHLSGGGGNDLLIGGRGADHLAGGAGRDRFRFLSLAQTGDTISDFSAVDRLEFRAAAFGGMRRGRLAASAFEVGRSSGEATRATTRFVFNAADRSLYHDADGVGGTAAVKVATLTATRSLRAAHIVLT